MSPLCARVREIEVARGITTGLLDLALVSLIRQRRASDDGLGDGGGQFLGYFYVAKVFWIAINDYKHA